MTIPKNKKTKIRLFDRFKKWCHLTTEDLFEEDCQLRGTDLSKKQFWKAYITICNKNDDCVHPKPIEKNKNALDSSE